MIHHPVASYNVGLEKQKQWNLSFFPKAFFFWIKLYIPGSAERIDFYFLVFCFLLSHIQFSLDINLVYFRYKTTSQVRSGCLTVCWRKDDGTLHPSLTTIPSESIATFKFARNHSESTRWWGNCMWHLYGPWKAFNTVSHDILLDHYQVLAWHAGNTRAVTCANQEKEGLGGQWKAHPKIKDSYSHGHSVRNIRAVPPWIQCTESHTKRKSSTT